MSNPSEGLNPFYQVPQNELTNEPKSSSCSEDNPEACKPLESIQADFYSAMSAEHLSIIELMQRYFAWSLYGLSVIWIGVILTLVLLSAIPTSIVLINVIIISELCFFVGGFLGIAISFTQLSNYIKPKWLEKFLSKHFKSDIPHSPNIKGQPNFSLFKARCNKIVAISAKTSAGFAFFGAILGFFFAIYGYPFCTEFNLNNSVLITLISSTTLAVLGIFAAVMKWLFPSIQKKSKS